MTKREKKLHQAIEISRALARVQYYKNPEGVLKKDKKNLLTASFEIRIKGVRGSVFGELNCNEAVSFLSKRARQERQGLNKLLVS